MLRTNSPIQLFPLLRIIIILIGGIVSGDLFHGRLDTTVLLFLFSLLLFIFFFVRKRPLLSGYILYSLVFVVGVCLYTIKRIDADACPKNVSVGYQAVIVSEPKMSGKVVWCDLLIMACNGAETSVPYLVRASILKDTASHRWQKLRLGHAIEGKSVFTDDFSNEQSGNFSFKRWMLANGISARTFIYKKDWNWIDSARHHDRLSAFWKLKLRMALLQERLVGMVERYVREDGTSAFLKAILLGDKSGLSVARKEAFSIAGVSHVLALSGLHLGIIYVLLSMLFVQVFKPLANRRVSHFMVQVMTLLAIWAYVFLVGMSSSILRSALMLSVYSVISLLDRDKMSINTLSFAGILMLVYNPMLVWDVSFQMSFVAVLSIFLFYKFIFSLVANRASNKLLLAVWALLAVSFAAQLGTAPLVAYYFGRFSNYFLLANTVVVPLTTCAIYLAVLMLALQSVPWAAGMLASALEKLGGFMTRFVDFVVSLPYASIENIHINTGQLYMIYMLIGCASLLCVHARKMIHFRRQFKHI